MRGWAALMIVSGVVAVYLALDGGDFTGSTARRVGRWALGLFIGSGAVLVAWLVAAWVEAGS